jgi:DNA-binding NarL/FixJ family response regulator
LNPMSVVLFSADLMAVSRVEGAAAKAGASVSAVTTAAGAVEACRAASTAILVVDLSAPSLDIGSLIHEVKSAGGACARVVAFGPHVHAERLAAAERAGCDEVVSRGQFFAQLDDILRRGARVAR